MDRNYGSQRESAGGVSTAWRTKAGACARRLADPIRDILSNPRVAIGLLLVLLADSAIELLDIFYRYRRIEGPRVSEYFYLSNDGSIGEYFEYLLTGLAACVLLAIAWRRRSRLIFVAGLLFTWLTLDNGFMIHETGGTLLEGFLGERPIFGVSVQDLGELGVYALAGTTIGIALLWASRGALSVLEWAALAVIAAAAGSAVFGVGFDLLHSMIPISHPILREIAGFIEDSGELWMISLASLLALGMPTLQGTLERD